MGSQFPSEQGIFESSFIEHFKYKETFSAQVLILNYQRRKK